MFLMSTSYVNVTEWIDLWGVAPFAPERCYKLGPFLLTARGRWNLTNALCKFGGCFDTVTSICAYLLQIRRRHKYYSLILLLPNSRLALRGNEGSGEMRQTSIDEFLYKE